MRTISFLSVIALGLIVQACSSASTDELHAAATPPGSFDVAASAATRSELGVERWTYESEQSISGKNAAGQAVVVASIVQNADAADGSRVVSYALKRDGATATLAIQRGAAGDVGFASTFTDKSRRAAELLANDLGAHAAAQGATKVATAGGLTPKTVEPQEGLTDGCNLQLVDKCNAIVAGYGEALGRAAKYCTEWTGKDVVFPDENDVRYWACANEMFGEPVDMAGLFNDRRKQLISACMSSMDAYCYDNTDRIEHSDVPGEASLAERQRTCWQNRSYDRCN